jgi:hypothetical protein
LHVRHGYCTRGVVTTLQAMTLSCNFTCNIEGSKPAAHASSCGRLPRILVTEDTWPTSFEPSSDRARATRYVPSGYTEHALGQHVRSRPHRSVQLHDIGAKSHVEFAHPRRRRPRAEFSDRRDRLQRPDLNRCEHWRMDGAITTALQDGVA